MTSEHGSRRVPVKSLGDEQAPPTHKTSSPKVFTGCLDASAAGTTQARRCTRHACASLTALRPKPQDKEAEIVSEALRTNGAQQSRPMRAEVVRRRWGFGGTSEAGADGAELQKRWAWLVVMLAAGRWVAKRGWPEDGSTTGRVGRLWLAPGGGSMRHDSGGAKAVGRWRDSCIRWAAPDGHAA